MSPRARRLAALLVGAVVLGVLLMHALSLAGGSHAAHQSAAAVHAAADHAGSDSPVAHGDGTGDGTGATVMLCAAMLLAAGALLVLRPGHRPLLPWAPFQPIAPDLGPGSSTSVLSARPPPVWRFSVVRC